VRSGGWGGWVDSVFPGWHRRAVGGLWDTLGPHQFEFLVHHGLRPEHSLLDVGCGSLRAGIHLARYLEPGHYAGIDIDADLLRAGRAELRREGLEDRSVTLMQMDDFDFRRLGRTFEFALAHSVFTHLPLNKIFQCIIRVEDALELGGRFFATYHENPGDCRDLEPIQADYLDPVSGEVRRRRTFYDRNPFHYSFDVFEWICDGTGLRVQNFGDWGHPRGQRMLIFTKS
jgi:SAM-dependent methyltransferase